MLGRSHLGVSRSYIETDLKVGPKKKKEVMCLVVEARR